ncbi:hypothetical protein [Proteiniphilum acetatigenes]|uniref:hypothetical protein n=1 Tax=Proteiniphilum acetatigenes TaxID=294710 RepID=UPI000378F63E|nr:hypothetical protein [Proteiniphilum acetatigenes]SFK31801.1 hypothetical protein SAMN05216357_101289 [Porphyromonadaceae bacterium KH3CP3RA]
MIVTPLFKKLNFKQHKEILIVNHPTEFEAELNAMKDYTTIKTDIKSVAEIEFVLIFVKAQAEVDTITPLIDKNLKGDGVVWFAYPKRTSKKYKAEINRDKGWNILGKSGFEAVRQVVINDDWSAVRFRKVEFIKTMNRRTNFAMTEEGRVKTKPSSR